jgi:hypothetical protein
MVRLRKDVQGLVAHRSFRFAPLTRSGRQLQAASGGSNIIITNFNSWETKNKNIRLEARLVPHNLKYILALPVAHR